MKKLKLNLEDLKVESFETTKGNNARGTVFGQASLPGCVTQYLQYTCDNCGGGTNDCPSNVTCMTDCGQQECQPTGVYYESCDQGCGDPETYACSGYPYCT